MMVKAQPKTFPPQRWEVLGKTRNKKGELSKYVITRTSDGIWQCSCNSWTNQKKVDWIWVKGVLQRVDCKHILEKKLELAVPGQAVDSPKRQSIEAPDRLRSISFDED